MNRRIAKKKFKQYIDNIITANSGDLVIIRWGKDISIYDSKNIKIFSSYLRKIAIEKNIMILIASPESDVNVIYKLENDVPINKVQYIFDRIISLYKEDNKDKIDSIYNQLQDL